MNKYKLILGIIGVILLMVFWNSTDKKFDCEQIISNIKSQKYRGKVVEKFIDEDQHNYKKVILRKDSETQVIFLDQEEGLFEYLRKGDSITKKENDLNVKIVRGKIDSIYHLDHYCLTQKSK